ncbi:ribosomal RNA large subunit methyltransferase H [Terrihabitans soli]|uniref:Ribosomal RNA large subunit methyltransferase H n=1 Tax=Terrihabitans soli TaxID=708113 RepID=A0A6S6QNB8_9HYPH|nr:23S rRNA (pseudouridine(1915)-N(3))-methyltransferase RlmH [Terrihabitans soli]BCJ89417.1 ribosomal RNA large subunit methyltransferase H [Terrihabitans soli]
MKLLIAAVGKLKHGPEGDLVARYADRTVQIGRALALAPFDIHEISESKAKRAEDRKREEAAGLTELLVPGVLIALDETGKTLTSTEFSQQLARWRDDGTQTAQFVIGGPDGLDPALRERAVLTMSFGRMTLPHQLVRALLAEQIYRAATILAGHPYHREG